VQRTMHRFVLVAVGISLIFAANAFAPSAGATVRASQTDELLVRYDPGAPPVRWNGRPWGSQCVEGVMARQLRTGRWIGAGMRIIRFDRAVTVKAAQRVATQFQRCPYIAWAEPNIVRFFLE